MSAQDELTATICIAVRQLTQIKKAQILLNIVLALIEDGQYGDEVEAYLDLFLKTPGLTKEDREKALLAQSNAQKLGGGQSLQSRNELPIHLSIEPACQRIPPEIWDQIAAQTPRYHLRTWLFLSPLHREIASRHIFHTIDINFLDNGVLDRGLEILDRASDDPVFASRVKTLRLHSNYDEGETWDLILRIFKLSLPAFKALRHFEWSGYTQLPADMVRALNTHKHLHGLGLLGRQFNANTVSTFYNLRKIASRPNFHIDGDWGDIRTMLDLNENTLKHLILGGREDLDNSLDFVFESVTINNLTHLDLWDIEVSNFLVDRIAHAHNLQSLTVHGSFDDPDFASGMFATDRLIDGTHTFLPHLESFRFDVDDEDEDLNRSVVHCIRKREKLRRLDLGSCPWHMVRDILPDLKNLRALAVCVDELSEEAIKSLVEALPTHMVAIGLSVNVRASDKSLDEYAHLFTCFNTLSFLNLALSTYPKKPDQMSETQFEVQIDKSLCSVAAAVPSLDFLAYDDRCYAVERSHSDAGPAAKVEGLLTRSNVGYGSGVDVVSDDIDWFQQNSTVYLYL